MNDTIDKSIIIRIKNILFRLEDLEKYRFFLFGSRADWTAKEKSDYDIWVICRKENEKIDSLTKLELEEKFESIPALIDFVDFSEVNEKFKKIAMKNVIWLNK